MDKKEGFQWLVSWQFVFNWFFLILHDSNLTSLQILFIVESHAFCKSCSKSCNEFVKKFYKMKSCCDFYFKFDDNKIVVLSFDLVLVGLNVLVLVFSQLA